MKTKEEVQRDNFKAIVLLASSLLMTSASVTNLIVDNNTCKIDGKTLKTLLELKNVSKYTTMDEEVKFGNLNVLVKQDRINRNNADRLNIISKLKDKKEYLKTLKKLKYNSRNTEEKMLVDSIKCSVANELDVDKNDLRIKSDDNSIIASYMIEDKNTGKTYRIGFNSAIYNAIERAYKLHKDKIPHDSAKDIGKSYSRTLLVVENMLEQAVSKDNDKLVDKFSKSGIKVKIKNKK